MANGKAQELRTNIVIGGRVDNTFTAMGDRLTELGSQIDEIGGKIWDFGEDSVETFAQYDDLMRETQAVGEYTAKEIEQLDKLNREIARTTTYTNIEAANAMVLIAQAGLGVEEIADVLPSTLRLAMAGNLDLADSVDYLISSLQSLDYEMSYADELVDQMAKTASIGMTDIDTLGQSLQRLGSGAQMFTGGSQEILTILSAMSQFGEDQRGSQAGTWLRNFMLSLAAPTGNIDDILDAMEQLGIAEEEIEEYAGSHSDGAAAQAVNTLIEAGLRIYDDQGKLLPAIDIIKGLRDTVRGSGEYADDLTELTGALNGAGGDIEAFMAATEGMTDNALYMLFSKIFGKRGITTALNLISISDAEWAEIYGKILGSEGYAERMGEIMQGGIGGALRELNAAWTELETTIGEKAAPYVETFADALHTITTSVSEMDESAMEGLVTGLGVIAAVGPGLKIAGGALKVIGMLATPGGALVAAAAVTAGLAAAIRSANEAAMEANFGEMSLEMDVLEEHARTLGAEFSAAYAEVNEFNAAVAAAAAGYEAASVSLSSSLLTNVLTGNELTEEDKAALFSLGEQMHTHLMSGIENSAAGSISYWEVLFGGAGTAEHNEAYQGIFDVTNESYQAAVAEAEMLSAGIREAMTSAFDDGAVSDEEYAEIKSWMQSYNDAMARAAAEAEREEDYIAFQKMLHKAQTASYDDVNAYAAEIEKARQEMLGKAEEDFLDEYFRAELRGASEEDLKAAKDRYEQQKAEMNARYSEALASLWEVNVRESDLAGAYSELEAMADGVLSGEMTAERAAGLFKGLYGNNAYAGEGDLGRNNTRTQLSEYLARMISGYGGYEGLMNEIAYYEKMGNAETAAYLRRLYTMQQINDDFAEVGIGTTLTGEGMIYSSAVGEAAFHQGHKEAYYSNMADVLTEDTLKIASIKDELAAIEAEIALRENRMEENAKSFLYQFTNKDNQDYAAIYGNVIGGNLMERRQMLLEELQELGEIGQDYLDDHPLVQKVEVQTAGSGGGLLGGIKRLFGFAEGGRTDEAAIFGEAGPEWAIPEAHTQRTAQLLDAARSASGFTWGELMTASGTKSSVGTLIYSPTIIARDARGVEQKLSEDKERLMRFLEEKELIDGITVYG